MACLSASTMAKKVHYDFFLCHCTDTDLLVWGQAGTTKSTLKFNAKLLNCWLLASGCAYVYLWMLNIEITEMESHYEGRLYEVSVCSDFFSMSIKVLLWHTSISILEPVWFSLLLNNTMLIIRHQSTCAWHWKWAIISIYPEIGVRNHFYSSTKIQFNLLAPAIKYTTYSKTQVLRFLQFPVWPKLS